jgi:hypothetical protein
VGLEQNSDEVALESIGLSVGGEAVVLPVGEAAAGADPERAVAIDEQGADEVVGQSVGGGLGLDL